MRKQILGTLFMLFSISTFSQAKNDHLLTLPKTVLGEWHSYNGKSEYNGKLIHKDFIEFGYRAFKYEGITQVGEGLYKFNAKDINGNTLNYQLKTISKDTIQLTLGTNTPELYSRQETPFGASRINISDIPKRFKKTWYTTDGKSNEEFIVADQKVTFRNETYVFEDLVLFGSKEKGEYRFVVKNNANYWMFYFKHWSDNYLQVGFNGKYGDLYKSNKEYPDYRIDDVEGYMSSIIPKPLRGNWLKADGSNLWSHSFFYDYALLDRIRWDYASVKKKGKGYVITLTSNGEERIMYAQPNADNTVSFGADRKSLVPYTIQRINKPNYKAEQESIFSADKIFENGIATYSGVIKNFGGDKNKTGMVHVDNIFTGKQDSHLVEINNDGHFSVSFPCYHLQEIYVRFPTYSGSAYVSPGKETWQLVNSSNREDVFFAGDLAQLNSDYLTLRPLVLNFEFYNKIANNIKKLSPKEYKNQCFKLKEKQLEKLDSVSKIRSFSKSAHKLMALELEYRDHMNVLSYDMHNNTSYKDSANVDKTYIDFVSNEVLNNKKALLTSSYTSFINRLRFLRFLREGIRVTHPDVLELAGLLKDQGVVLTIEEQELVELHLNYNKENAEAIQKRKDFDEKHQDISISISKKYSDIYQKMTTEERVKYTNEETSGIDFTEYLKVKNIDLGLTDEEKKYQEDSKNILTKEEQERSEQFHSEAIMKRNRAFTEKYKAYVNAYVSEQLSQKGINRVKEAFGDTFTTDIIIAQYILSNLSRNYEALGDKALERAEKQVHDPFIASVFSIENDKLKAKIEANKSKTGFVINETPKAEGDKVFEAIIEKYKGKVVFVDFWATWCGPCRSGIERIKPLKEAMKDEAVAFVYITNPTSPENTYNNMIPDIKGQHYRISQDEWNYLSARFNITGIPHYLLIDKEGNLIKHNTSDLRMPESLKPLLEKYLN